MTSHAHLTFDDLGLASPELEAFGNKGNERIFRRDCLEVDFRIGGRPVTIYCVHFKSMGSPRNGLDGRQATMPLRTAEARAVRRIIEDRFGAAHAGKKNWVICGDLNDYAERIVIEGGLLTGQDFRHAVEEMSAVREFTGDGFCENVLSRLPEMERWTLYHTRGPRERHLCQLDYVLLSQRLAETNRSAMPSVIRGGQPFRTPFPPGQEPVRYPRVGWDRPKASDHCPVAITLDLI